MVPSDPFSCLALGQILIFPAFNGALDWIFLIWRYKKYRYLFDTQLSAEEEEEEIHRFPSS